MTKVFEVLTTPGRTWFCVFLVLAAGLAPAPASVPIQPLGIERLPGGNTLIADSQNDQALEVDSLGRLVWAYIRSDVPFLHTARRLAGGNTLMTSSAGNRVVEVNPRGDTVWTMKDGLWYPNDATRLANGNTLITDRNNNRVIEVTPERQIVWSYSGLNLPHNGSRLANGHTLVCDGDNNRVLEVDSSGSIVWKYSTGLSWARCAQRLDDGHTVIADARHNQVVEVNEQGAMIWAVGDLPLPFAAQRLANGNTLVSAGPQVVELTPEDSLVWQYPNTVSVVVETLKVVNPASGCSLYVHVHRPAYADSSLRVPGVVFVPGGTGFGSSYDTTGLPDAIASDGFTFLHFDPDGRGLSDSCPENYDGYLQQDGLHACLSLLASRDYVDTSRLGIYSRHYGITMASGAIARYAEPRVAFLLDYEGPADRSQTCEDSGGYVPVPGNADAFWQEREAARFMKQVPSAYLRMQTAVDRNPAVPDNRHCIQLVDSATAVAYGGAGISVGTRVNDSVMNRANRVYTLKDAPSWIPEEQERLDLTRILLYLHELAEQGPPAVTEGKGVVPAGALQVRPRPCRGILLVELPEGARARDLRVHDVCGRLVKRSVVPAGNRQAELDLLDLPPGTYYVSAAGAGTASVIVLR